MSPQTAYLSDIDPEFATVATSLPPTPAIPLDVAACRETFRRALRARSGFRKNSARVDIPPGAIHTKHFMIPVGEGVEIKAVSYIPAPDASLSEEESHTYPLLFWMHGGGYFMGNHTMDEKQLHKLAFLCRISVISVDYRLAPEYPFPTGLNDSYAGLKWAVVNSNTILQADTRKGFLIGGISAGANFAAVLAHLAKDDPQFTESLTGQILIIPLLISPSAVPKEWKEEMTSHQQNANAPILDMKYIEGFEALYQAPPSDPRYSPALFPSHKGLPPAYISANGLDPLRDDAFLYKRLLEDAGVPVKLDAYKGVPHAFFAFLPRLSASRKYARDVVEGTMWLLSAELNHRLRGQRGDARTRHAAFKL